MTIWLLRFAPYAGGPMTDGYFRSEARAKGLYGGFKDSDIRVDFTDDFGVSVSLNPSMGVLLLTNTDTSAAMNKDLNEANHDAARRQGIVPKIVTGSTVQ